MTTANPQLANELGEENSLAFAPLHKRYFGVAIGSALGLVVFVFTLVHVFLLDPGEGIPLGLLAQYFYGYQVSVTGAFVGGAWGFFMGWVGGWFVAFCRNLTIATAVFAARAPGNLRATSDFLDHI